ncbi:MAG: hypothetical protein E7192_02840 [Erysipelotrichaceae bacterium]|nr:hypothetical protein [Erysipelotrichaceae bacterium]
MKRVFIAFGVVVMMTGCTAQNRSKEASLKDNQSLTSPAPTAETSFISVNEAKQIALNYFDQNEQNVVFDDVKTVLDDGRTLIEIEMSFNQRKIEIEIDALTGAVLDVDEEKDYSNK